MKTKLFAVGGFLLLVVAGIAGAFLTGVGPAPGDDSGSDIESFPTETATATPSDSSGDDGSSSMSMSTSTADETTAPPFGFSIDSMETCGQTCRDVTSTLTNQQQTPAENLTVYTRIYVGNGTDGDVVWQGKEPVGTLDAGESYTATRRVELSYSEGLAVEQHDGWVTVQTTVQTADQTVTFTEQWQID